MLKNIDNYLRQWCLAAALTITCTQNCPAYAAIGPQAFADGQNHIVTDNIDATGYPVGTIGLSVFNAGTSAVMSERFITTTSGYAIGIQAENNSSITLNNVAVTTGGDFSCGVFTGHDSTINMTGGSISTTGELSFGAYTYLNSTMTLTNVPITTTGYYGFGVLSTGGAALTMTGGSITTTGEVGFGALAESYSTLTMTDVAITTSGATGIGALAQGGGSLIMTEGSITTSGIFSAGVLAETSSTLSMTGGSITTSGLVSDGASARSESITNLTNVAITAAGTDSYALYSEFSGNINANVSGQDIFGAGGLMKADGGSVNLSATGSSRLYGNTVLWNGGALNLTLGGNAAWTMPGDSSLSTLSMNGGSVRFTPPTANGPYKVLTVSGNLAGSGGIFNMNANPGAGLSDLIVIAGTASGAHRLSVLNQGNSQFQGAIKMVDLDDITANTATFSGGGDFGPYRWALVPGSAVPTGYSGVDSLADYYLYNTLLATPSAAATVSIAASPSVVWYGEMNDIKKRMGELRLGASSDDFWARTYAGKYTVKPGSQSFDQISRGLEIGKDKKAAIAGGKRYLGWVAGVGRAENSFSLGGSGSTDSFYLGAYGSWLKGDGSYIDLVAKHNWFKNRFDSPVLGAGNDSAAYKNNGFGLSVETGKRIEKGSGVFIEPQVELAALWSSGKNFTTANGLNVSAPGTSSLQLRLGAAFGKKTVTRSGNREIYSKLSWVEELAGRSHIAVDDAVFDSSLRGGRLVIGLGFVEDTAKHQLYFDFERAWGKTTSKPWGINLGCRWKL